MNRSVYAPAKALPITACQRRVWALVAEGKENKEVACALGMRYGTVKAHMTEVLRRIGARNRVEAALKFHGLR